MKLIHLTRVLLTGLLLAFFIKCSDNSKGSSTLGVPVFKDAANITANSFTAQWIGVTGASAYLLDVSTDANFNIILSSYNKKMVSGESAEVNNLTEKTTYYLRLKATNGTSESDFSGVKSFTTTAAPEVIPAQRDEPLRIKTKFKVGVALQAGRLSGDYATRVKNEFSSITAEYQMKMDPIFVSPGNYNFIAGDNIVAFAAANKMTVHAHALIWYLAVPSFVQNFTGTNQEFEDMVHKYITDVVTHYKGKVASWDVVNEAIEDGNSGALRNSVFRQKMGDDYIAKCFKWAREADPDVLLFYNDYSIEWDNPKSAAMLNLITDLKTRGIPFDGLGFQMHIDTDFPSQSQLKSIVDKVVAKGVKIHFSEVDIRVNKNNTSTFLTVSAANTQKAKYKEVVTTFKTIPESQQYGVTVWGLIDSQTWLLDFYKQPEWPLLFFDDLKPKPAHTGFLEALEL